MKSGNRPIGPSWPINHGSMRWRWWALINSGATNPSPSDCLSLPNSLLHELSPSRPQHDTTLPVALQQPAQGHSLEFLSRGPSAKTMGHSHPIMCIFVPKQTTPYRSICAAACYWLGWDTLQPWEAETSWRSVRQPPGSCLDLPPGMRTRTHISIKPFC